LTLGFGDSLEVGFSKNRLLNFSRCPESRQ
jgi:hypothetical protein